MGSRHILENIGIRPLERRVFTLANGERIERGFGGAIFEVEERRGHAPVVFGEKEDKCLLGMTALEALGLEVMLLRENLSLWNFYCFSQGDENEGEIVNAKEAYKK